MAKAHATNSSADEQPATPEARPHCGIIMPMGDTEGYPPGHWGQVQVLIARAANKAGFSASIVGADLPNDMIQASIVRGIYQDPVVVCDVSSLNPNVMLELGLRMATQLPLVLVFDGELNYPFDINNILHVRYPKGLNIFKMEEFVEKLADKIKTVSDAKGYRPFLSHFEEVSIKPSTLGSTTKSIDEAVGMLLEQMGSLRAEMKVIRQSSPANSELYTREQLQRISVFNGVTIMEREAIARHWNEARESFPKAVFAGLLTQRVVNELHADSPDIWKNERGAAIRRFIDYMIVSGPPGQEAQAIFPSSTSN